MPRLARITVYPIKSFDGVRVAESAFVAAGGLESDRRFALIDDHGRFVNGKRLAELHRVRAAYADDLSTVTLVDGDGRSETFALRAGDADLARWCRDRFGIAATLRENVEAGFPDDLNAAGPTLVSTATLRRAGEWFDLDREESRRRFRANLEIDAAEPDDCPAFWEDRLFAPDAAPDARAVVEFRIGDVLLHGVNPCARCVVPTRDSRTGEAAPHFVREFGARRRDELPPWAPPTAFDHFYRLAVNTRVPPSQTGRRIRTGDVVIA